MEAVVDAHNFTRNLPESEAYALRDCLKARRFTKGEMIFRTGDAPDAFFQLATGAAALCNYSADGQEFILTKYQPGDWLGDTGIVDGRTRINTAIALEDSDLLSLSRADFNRLCDSYPKILRAFSVMQANHIRMLLNLLVDASLLRLPGRVVRTIQRLLMSQGKLDADGLSYIECSHDELARCVAASRQSTSIELKKLENAGTIRSAYGKIYVIDPVALAASGDHLTSFETIAARYDDEVVGASVADS